MDITTSTYHLATTKHSITSPCRISNVTNSEDPKDMKARIFVGNLNTLKLNKSQVKDLFKRYGPVVAISLHRGYAFIQFQTEDEARSAVIGEDQRVYAGQRIGEWVLHQGTTYV